MELLWSTCAAKPNAAVNPISESAFRRALMWMLSSFSSYSRADQHVEPRPATLTGESGGPTRASASVVVIISVAGTARPDAMASPTSETTLRREITSDLIFSIVTASCWVLAQTNKAAVSLT